MEIGYAAALGKPLYAFSDKDPDMSRKILFADICPTPKSLMRKLK